MFKTVDEKSWNVQATTFKLGYNNFRTEKDTPRVVSLNPHLPYIYVPDDDW